MPRFLVNSELSRDGGDGGIAIAAAEGMQTSMAVLSAFKPSGGDVRPVRISLERESPTGCLVALLRLVPEVDRHSLEFQTDFDDAHVK